MPLDVTQLSRPGADPAATRNTNRAQDLILAKMAGSQPAGAPPPTAAAVANAGAGATQQVGADVLKQTAAEVQQMKGAASNVVAGQATEAAGQLGQAKLARQAQSTKNEAQLASMDATTKKQLLDDRMNFQSTQVGVGTLQTSQLMDWAVSKAQSQQQLADYQQQVQQATQKQIAMYKQGYDAMSATLEAESKGQIQKLDESTKLQIAAAQADFHQKWLQAQAQAAAHQQMFAGGGAVVGGIIGAIYGGPAGAAAGSSVGGAAGGVAGGTT